MVARVLAICALASASLVDDDHVKRELQGADNTDALTSKWTSPELTGNLKVIQDTKKWWGRTRRVPAAATSRKRPTSRRRCGGEPDHPRSIVVERPEIDAIRG